MNIKPILLVAGEPNSIFLEIFFKTLKIYKSKNPIILICSEKLLKMQMKKLRFKKEIKFLSYKKISKYILDNDSINLINVNYNPKKAFEKISKKSNTYIENSFEIAFKIIKNNNIYKLINGPISKKNFLGSKYLGITEYISKKFKIKTTAMLIYNKNLSVCPITTHLPIKKVSKNIKKHLIFDKICLIDNFYREKFRFKPSIGILGLNPHCESIDKFNEDEKIIKPSIKNLLLKKIKISGPYSADTIFLKNNRKKFDVIIGMYHDQVLTPIKTIFEYDAINVTMGLPFLRVTPDHGPNEKMIGKNISNPISLIRSLEFLDKK